MKFKKVAVIADIHGNADALEYALKKIDLESVDITLFLGDLLTYGCQPIKVLQILSSYKKKT